MDRRTVDERARFEEASLLDETAGLWRALRDLVVDALDLLTLEGRLAAVSLARIVALALFIGVAAAGAWLALLAALALSLAQQGIDWPLVFLGVAAASGAALVLAWIGVRRVSRNVLFTATRRHLGATDADRETERYPVGRDLVEGR